MASIFVVKGKIETPMEWYARVMKYDSKWEFDGILGFYHLGEVYIKEDSDRVSFEDMSENEFFGWDTSSWIALADGKELMYGYYSDDSGSAEFIHIKNGECIREYRVYDFEVDIDMGSTPGFDNWTDVAKYVDENLL